MESFHVVNLAVFVHDPVNTESEENKTLRKYASILRQKLRMKTSQNIGHISHHMRSAAFRHGASSGVHWRPRQQRFREISNAWNFQVRFPDISKFTLPWYHSDISISNSTLISLCPGWYRPLDLLWGRVFTGSLKHKDRIWRRSLGSNMQHFLAIEILFYNNQTSSKAPNDLKIVAEKPHKSERAKYRKAVHHAALYRAASRLWNQGVDISTAVSIVESAMQAAGEIS